MCPGYPGAPLNAVNLRILITVLTGITRQDTPQPHGIASTAPRGRVAREARENGEIVACQAGGTP